MPTYLHSWPGFSVSPQPRNTGWGSRPGPPGLVFGPGQPRARAGRQMHPRALRGSSLSPTPPEIPLGVVSHGHPPKVLTHCETETTLCIWTEARTNLQILCRDGTRTLIPLPVLTFRAWCEHTHTLHVSSSVFAALYHTSLCHRKPTFRRASGKEIRVH